MATIVIEEIGTEIASELPWSIDLPFFGPISNPQQEREDLFKPESTG